MANESSATTNEDIAALRDAANDAIRNVRNNYIFFVLAGVYIAVIVGSTTDEMLLRQSPIKLPILNVGLPIVGAYLAVPLMFLILHLNLLVQLRLLSEKLHAFESVMRSMRLDRKTREMQRNLILPFPFAVMILRDFRSTALRPLLTTEVRARLRESEGGESRRWLGRLAAAMMWLSVVILPVLFLLGVQLWFVRYHDPIITALHQAVIAVDLVLLWTVWRTALYPRRWRRARTGWRAGRWLMVGGVTRGAGWLATAAAAWIVLFDAIPPDHSLDRFGPKQGNRLIHALNLRNLFLRDLVLVRREPPAALVGRCPINDEACIAEVWRRHAVGLDLRERDLRGADFSRSILIKADLRGARLENAILRSVQLQGGRMECLRAKVSTSSRNQMKCVKRTQLIRADLQFARLMRARFRGANLQGANLAQARLQGARAWEVRLQDAILSLAHLEGAYLHSAHLEGAYLHSAHLEGANLHSAHLEGALAIDVYLEGAHLVDAHLQGTYLSGAHLQGANLRGANLEGANLRGARLEGADLKGADLRGVNLREAHVQGAKLPYTFTLDTDLRGLVFRPLTKKEDEAIRAKLRSAIKKESTLNFIFAQLEQARKIGRDGYPTAFSAPLLPSMALTPMQVQRHTGDYEPYYAPGGPLEGWDLPEHRNNIDYYYTIVLVPLLVRSFCKFPHAAKGIAARAVLEEGVPGLAAALLDAPCLKNRDWPQQLLDELRSHRDWEASNR